jgi:hypothetical protein
MEAGKLTDLDLSIDPETDYVKILQLGKLTQIV